MQSILPINFRWYGSLITRKKLSRKNPLYIVDIYHVVIRNERHLLRRRLQFDDHILSRNGSSVRICEHLEAGSMESQYMASDYVANGEKSPRLPWRMATCALGLLLGICVLTARCSVLNTAQGSQHSYPMCILFLTLPAVLAMGAYYGRCSSIETEYDARPRDEAVKWKIQASRFLDPGKRWEEVALGCLNAGIGAFLASALVLMRLLYGCTRIYFDMNEHGLVWFAASFIVLFFYVEFWAYVFHRCLHHEWLYRHFHKIHHRYQPPTAFAAIAIHPVEFIGFVLGGQAVFWFVPVHPIVAFVVSSYTMYHLIEDHSGVKKSTMKDAANHTNPCSFISK